MSNSLTDLINLSNADKEIKGVQATPEEIYQQPEMWRETLKIIKNQKEEIIDFLGDQKDRQFILSGAGTSAFIGLSLANLFNKVSGYDTKAIATTDIITDPDAAFQTDAGA